MIVCIVLHLVISVSLGLVFISAVISTGFAFTLSTSEEIG